MLERLARDKHSSLLRTFVNYVCKTFYNIGPRSAHVSITFKKASLKVIQASLVERVQLSVNESLYNIIRCLAISHCTSRGAQKLMGENQKLARAEFSTISQAVLVMCTYVSMLTHAHIYSRKLGPGLVLLARVCPCTSLVKYFQ